MNTKKLMAFFAMLLLAFSLTACGGGDAQPAADEEVVVEDVTDVPAAAEGELSDEEFLETMYELVDLLESMEAMDETAAMGAMGQLFELAAKLEGMDDARAEGLIESDPELKAALEKLDSMGQ